MNIDMLSIEEKIAQKLMFGVNSKNIDVIVELIKNYAIGGVILYKNNYSSYPEMLNVIKKLKEANKNNKLPLFIAIDQEGGVVNRMPSEFHVLKNIYHMSFKDKNLIYSNASITAKMLYEAGINMNFAPVLDIYEKGTSKVLNKRCFYGDYNDVSNMGLEYINGLNDNNIISVMKHFPGHGISKMDSHFITPYVFNYKSVLEKHIRPFECAFQKNVPAVMLGHLVIRKLTNGLPASISSKFIREYIRERNNFNGLIITDEINMLSHNILYRFNYIEKAILAGSDIILIKIKDNGVNILEKFNKLINNNLEYMDILDESVMRIIRIKEKYNINDNINYIGSDILNLNKRIDELNNLCE